MIQAFNDYRMPLFDYSIVPIIAAFGLKPWVVRFGAALWGIGDLIALAALAGLMLGSWGAAFAALIAALSPWHLPVSRFGHEAITAATTTTVAVGFFAAFLRRQQPNYLLLSGMMFAVSLYSYSITKVTVPLMFVLIVCLYWRELRRAARKALVAVMIVVIGTVPQAIMIVRHYALMQARFNQISILREDGLSCLRLMRDFIGGCLRHFQADFLFASGASMQLSQVPSVGRLGIAQCLPIALGLVALADDRYRRSVILLVGWLLIASVPAGLTHPAPSALHNILAIAPWTLLSALGVVFLLDFASNQLWLPALIMSGSVVLAVIIEGLGFVWFYFDEYPQMAAAVYQYGLQQAITGSERTVSKGESVVVTSAVNQPYIYVLFYGKIPPAVFQNERVEQEPRLFAPVQAFGRYRFTDPWRAFSSMEHGLFVFSGGANLPAPALLSVQYPEGGIAYSVVAK